MASEDQARMDDIYGNTPLEQIPWNSPTPPQLLVELVESGKVQPCRAIDIGCGAGNYAIYLAGKGFQITGIDFSPTAVRIAKENAQTKGAVCDFFVCDAVDQLGALNQKWEFAYDWGLLHHIFPEQRPRYAANVCAILVPGGKYLSVSFSEKDKGFGGRGKYRKTSLESTLYFSSLEELRELFECHFRIIELKTIDIEGKFETHTFNYVFMEKK